MPLFVVEDAKDNASTTSGPGTTPMMRKTLKRRVEGDDMEQDSTRPKKKVSFSGDDGPSRPRVRLVLSGADTHMEVDEAKPANKARAPKPKTPKPKPARDPTAGGGGNNAMGGQMFVFRF